MNKILTIIPVHNRKEITLSNLKNISCIEKSGFKLDIIVIDDGSTDGTSEEIIKLYPNVKLHYGDGNLWWGGSINFGFQYAIDQGYDFVYTINDDLILNNDSLLELFNYAIIHPSSICSSVILGPNGKIVSAGYRCGSFSRKVKGLFEHQDYSVLKNNIFDVETISTQSVLIPVSIIKQGYFLDTDHFPHNYSDIEYFLRLSKAGFNITVIKNSTVIAEPSSSNYAKFILNNSYNKIYESFFNIKYAHCFHTQWNIAHYESNLFVGVLRFILLISPYAIWFILRLLFSKNIVLKIISMKNDIRSLAHKS